MANKISKITRRNIFDAIKEKRIVWSGRLNEIEFLSRIFNLESIESFDSRFKNVEGEIHKHRIINPNDWDDYWIFEDKRFDLLKCDDSTFLKFLCEMIHPLVRGNNLEVHILTEIFNENLSNDGFEIVEKSKISGKPVFVSKQKVAGSEIVSKRVDGLKRIFNEDYVIKQINIMEDSIENAPHISIGVSKELIETCCKSIFEERNKQYNIKWDLPKLMKETTKLLKLTPDDIPNESRAVNTITQILGSLSSIVQGISELRNEYGSGHGKNGKFTGLQPRHARLAVGAASVLAIFLLETNKIKK